MADDFWWIQKTVKKAVKDIFMGVGHMQHFFLLDYLRRTLIDEWEINLRFNLTLNAKIKQNNAKKLL